MTSVQSHGSDYSEQAGKESVLANGLPLPTNGNGSKAWEWLWRALSVVVIPWAMWMSVAIIDIKTRIAVIESNRFTAADGVALWRAVDGKAEKSEVPPQWFLERVGKLEEEFDEHVERTGTGK